MDSKFCNHKNKIIKHKDTDTIHKGGGIYCADCDKFLGWAKTKNNGQKRTTSTKYKVSKVAELKGYKTPFCFFCRREKNMLGLNETLTIDHILPIREGGLDVLNNINILCSSCHALRHHEELYHYTHFKNIKKGDNK